MLVQIKCQFPRAMLFCRAVFLTFGVSGAASVLADDEGTELATKVYNRPDGKDSSSRGVMVLTEAGHAPRERRVISYRRDEGKGEAMMLMRFTDPAEIRGTAVLTLDHEDDDTEQWLYLPELERVRRISSSRMGGRFVGSDLFYEDLRTRKVDQDEHEIKGQDQVNGKPCTLLESIPTDSDNSVYLKRLSCIDMQTLLPLRIDYFEKSEDRPSKRWELLTMKRLQGYWTVMHSAMTDLGSGHRTEMSFDKFVYDKQLPESLFTTHALEDESLESQFRP